MYVLGSQGSATRVPCHFSFAFGSYVYWLTAVDQRWVHPTAPVFAFSRDHGCIPSVTDSWVRVDAIESPRPIGQYNLRLLHVKSLVELMLVHP